MVFVCFDWVLYTPGPIPAKLGQLANLQQLNLRYNMLTGNRIATLGQNKNAKMYFFLLDKNQKVTFLNFKFGCILLCECVHGEARG